jgi:hypothetical protein
MISKGKIKEQKNRYSLRVQELRLELEKSSADHVQVTMESVPVLLLSRLRVQESSKRPVLSTYTGLKSR